MRMCFLFDHLLQKREIFVVKFKGYTKINWFIFYMVIKYESNDDFTYPF